MYPFPGPQLPFDVASIMLNCNVNFFNHSRSYRKMCSSLSGWRTKYLMPDDHADPEETVKNPKTSNSSFRMWWITFGTIWRILRVGSWILSLSLRILRAVTQCMAPGLWFRTELLALFQFCFHLSYFQRPQVVFRKIGHVIMRLNLYFMAELWHYPTIFLEGWNQRGSSSRNALNLL